MKKTLLALSVLVAAGAANAAEVYNKDGFTLDLYGDAEVKYVLSRTSDEATIVLGDSDFGFSTTSQINDDFTAYAKIEFDGDEDDGTDPYNSNHTLDLDDLYIGVKGKGFTAQIGKQVTLVDDIGISNDYTFGLDTAEDTAGMVSEGNQTVKLAYSADMFTVATTYINKADGDNATDDVNQIALNLGLSFADVDVNLWYADESGVTSAADKEVMALKVAYAIDAVTLSALYSAAESGSTDIDSYAANVKYAMNKYTFNLGMANVDTEGSDDVNTFYGNVIYAVTPKVNAVLELSDSDADNNDLGYSVGMTFAF